MENLEKKKSHNWIWWLIAMIIACVTTGFIVHNNGPEIDKLLNRGNDIGLQESIVCEDTTYAEPSIQDILEFREHARECKRIDSIFMTMPDVVLIDILMNHGTSLSNSDIVYIYKNNPETYNAVQSGARAQRYKEQIEPDSLPTKPIPDKLE